MMRLRNRMAKRLREAGQGMIEYGLIVGMVATWVIIFMLALKPLFSERFAVEAIENAGGQGRATMIAELGVTMADPTLAVDDGGADADDF